MNKGEIKDIHGKSFNRMGMIIVLLIGTFAGMLMQTSLGTAIPTLMRDFDVNLATANQATTWFLLANGIMIPVSAYLTTKIRTKYLYLIAYTMLLGGMALSAFTPADHDMWWMFLAGRIIVALGNGIAMPLMQVVMVNIFPASERGSAMGLGGIVIGMAPALGPTLSGWILEENHHILGLVISNSWRTIFYLPLIVLGIAYIFAFFVLRDVVPNKPAKLDVLSLVLSVLGFGAFLLGFTNVSTDGWGDIKTVIAPSLVGVILIVLFIVRQLHMESPFLNVRAFQNGQFSIATVAVMLVTMAMMGVEMILPTYLQNVHGMSTLNSGLVLLPGALLMGLMAPVSGGLYDKIGIKRLAIIGFAIIAAGTLPFMFLSATTPAVYITVLYAVRMFGVSLAMMPLTTMAMAVVPVEEAPHATAANNTARQIASAVVVALLTSVTQNIINNNQPASALQTANPIAYAGKYMTASLDGFHASFAIGFAFAIVGIIVSLFLQKGKIETVVSENGREEA